MSEVPKRKQFLISAVPLYGWVMRIARIRLMAELSHLPLILFGPFIINLADVTV